MKKNYRTIFQMLVLPNLKPTLSLLGSEHLWTKASNRSVSINERKAKQLYAAKKAMRRAWSSAQIWALLDSVQTCSDPSISGARFFLQEPAHFSFLLSHPFPGWIREQIMLQGRSIVERLITPLPTVVGWMLTWRSTVERLHLPKHARLIVAVMYSHFNYLVARLM